MLNYGWADSSSPMLIAVDDSTTQSSDQTSQIFDHYSQNIADNFLSPPSSSFSFHQQPNQVQFHSLYDSVTYSHPMSPEMVTGTTNGCMVLPKTENCGSMSMSLDFPARIGLNLGGRTYFSSSDDDIVNRLYRRPRLTESGPSNWPKCQVESCNADLTHAKNYHRRHKVCEFHSKASTVFAGGMTQRFCQQCSRFHLLSEFDQGKRSCRKRLADHNRRRRKSQPHQPQSQSHNESYPSETLASSSLESVVNSSAVTVAVSPAALFSEMGNFRAYEQRGMEFKK